MELDRPQIKRCRTTGSVTASSAPAPTSNQFCHVAATTLTVLEVDTSTYHYKSRRREQAGIEARIREICETRVRYGYRRVHVLLRREGWEINVKRTRRIYNALGLQLRHKTPKRRVKAKLRDGRREAAEPQP